MKRTEYSEKLAEFKDTVSLESATRKLFKDLFGMTFYALVPGKDIRDKHFKNHNFTFQYLNDALSKVEHVWDIGATINTSNEDMIKADGTEGNKYSFLYVYACEATPVENEHETMSRGCIKDLASVFNRIASSHNYYRDPAKDKIDIPVIVVVRQGKFLSIATCERMKCKYDNGEKMGKVTILRNIDCSNPHPGHIQNLDKIAQKVKEVTTYEDLYKEWLAAFDIGILSKPFFDEYREIYADIVALITNKRMVKHGNKWEEELDTKIPETEKIEKGLPILEGFRNFEDPEKAIRDYVKKLMGRLVFIHFLQKKGWMGVPAGDGWTGGREDFLKELFAHNQTDTFVDDILEPLFNDLNTDRKENGYLANSTVGSNVKVPYLNGGLFEPDDYDKASFPLPKEYMAKMLNFFARYNFTIDENAPDDVEVAVDPEMLSVIFESLLEDNKDKGAFYTPKEIVEYMCRESLIAYLQTNETDDEVKERYRAFVTSHKLDKLELEDVAYVEKKLKEIKVCDPAIGSGAFPMGMLKELFECRRAIERKSDKRSFLQIKKEIIQNSIYGVDIEKGAVDIARLRFWLALIIDEETPDALPNMDFKIMQGNSLLEQFDNIKLDNIIKDVNKIVAHRIEHDALFQGEKHYTLEEMLDAYYNISVHDAKVEQKNLIDECVSEYIRIKIAQKYKSKAMQAKKTEVSDCFAKLKLENSKFFLWHTWFADVFANDGFDIVIGNPPYIDSETMVKIMPKERELYAKKFACACGNWDMFIAFIEFGMSILKEKGIFSNIIPNKLIAAKYAIEMRKHLSSKYIIEIRDYSRIDVFEDAAVYPITIVLRNDKEIGNSLFTIMENRMDVKRSNVAKSVNLSKANYWDPFFADSPVFNLISKINSFKELKELPVEVSGAATVADAYEIKNILQDDSNTEGFKLVNSGTIDPYVFYWGIKQCRYIKNGYMYPVVPFSDLKNYSNVRFNQAKTPKIIVASMTTKYEACLDTKGEYVAGKSTTIIIGDKKTLYKLTAIINSKLASYWINIVFNSLKMSGGAINIGKNELQVLPIPSQDYDFEELVEEVIESKTASHFADTSAVESHIDRLVYELYGLTNSEVKIIDPNEKTTGEDEELFKA